MWIARLSVGFALIPSGTGWCGVREKPMEKVPAFVSAAEVLGVLRLRSASASLRSG